MQSSKLNESKKLSHSSKRSPRSLQSLNRTSLKLVLFKLAILKSQFSNTHSENIIPARSVFVKIQPVKVQFSYSAFTNPFSVKFSLLKSLFYMYSGFIGFGVFRVKKFFYKPSLFLNDVFLPGYKSKVLYDLIQNQNQI